MSLEFRNTTTHAMTGGHTPVIALGVRKPLHGFTLIELLVVITVIALLMALLLPALELARESAQNVVCSSNNKQISLAALTYLEDNDGYFPPGDDALPNNAGGGYWPKILLPWIGDENAYYDPKSYLPGRNVTYRPNGWWWMFIAEWAPGPEPTSINSIKTPSKLVLIREDVEDLVLAERGITTPYPYLAANYHGWYEYLFGASTGTSVSSGRHFRTGATTTRIGATATITMGGWGFDNTSFVDGHVISVSMRGVVELAIPNVVYLQYPIVKNGARSQVNTPFPGPGPLPGSEFWFVPSW